MLVVRGEVFGRAHGVSGTRWVGRGGRGGWQPVWATNPTSAPGAEEFHSASHLVGGSRREHGFQTAKLLTARIALLHYQDDARIECARRAPSRRTFRLSPNPAMLAQMVTAVAFRQLPGAIIRLEPRRHRTSLRGRTTCIPVLTGHDAPSPRIPLDSFAYVTRRSHTGRERSYWLQPDPYNYGRPFGDHSDFDVVVVSDVLVRQDLARHLSMQESRQCSAADERQSP